MGAMLAGEQRAFASKPSATTTQMDLLRNVVAFMDSGAEAVLAKGGGWRTTTRHHDRAPTVACAPTLDGPHRQPARIRAASLKQVSELKAVLAAASYR